MTLHYAYEQAAKSPRSAAHVAKDVCPLCGAAVTYRGFTTIECAGAGSGCPNYVAPRVGFASDMAVGETHDYAWACTMEAIGVVVETYNPALKEWEPFLPSLVWEVFRSKTVWRVKQ